MRRRAVEPSDDDSFPQAPASTPEAREAQMINYAVNLAEKQLREGTASAQVISHYLKMGSSRELLEQQKIGVSIELDRAKANQIANAARTEELFAKAIDAMRSYQTGIEVPPEEADEYE